MRFIVICLLFAVTQKVAASDIPGTAQAMSADTLIVDGQIYQLRGVAAPEPVQSCQSINLDWPCGLAALKVMARQLASNRIRCTEIRNELVSDVLSAICYANNQTISLNQWIVENGWALASDGSEFISLERQAQQAGVGIWRDNFNPAPRWRMMAKFGYVGLIPSETGCDVCAARHSRIQRK